MPSAVLYGRRWHFSTDIVAVHALLSALFHATWIVVLLVAAAGAAAARPGVGTSGQGVQYLALFIAYLAVFGVNLVLDLLLAWHSLQGAPFEASKRRWVVPLLYACTAPLVATLGLTAWGSYVSTQLEPDCWQVEQRSAVTNLAQGLVFATWGFMFVAAAGIAVTYNAFPAHADLSSWEARCECLAATLCCSQNVMRKPDGKRPLVTNIAELGAGLLSHADLDATDITAALLLASAAQNRRRRLRIARALLPVYQALRDGGGLSSSGSAVDERASTSGVEEEDSDDDASSEATSVNDVPADRDLDRMIAEREAERRQEAGRRLAEQQAPKLAGVGKADGAPQRGTAQPSPLGPRRRGKTVSWAQDRLEQAAAAAAVAPRPRNAAPARGPPDLSGISLPPPALRLQQQQQAKEQAEEQQQPEQLQADMQAPAGGVDLGGSLPLTADNVSLWEEHVAAVQGRQALIDHPVEAVLGMGDSGPAAASDAEKAAGELLEQMPSELPHQEAIDQLAGAIEEEIATLGGGRLPEDEAVLQIAKEESLDLSALQVDPEAPSIWFSTAASQAAAEAAEALSSRGSRLAEGGEAAAGAAPEEGVGAQEEEEGQGDLATESPFYTAGGGSRAGSGAAEAIPPADEAAAAAVAEVAAAAAAAADGSPRQRPADAGSGAGGSSVAPSSRLDVHRQLTVRYPVVITPSEHVDKFGGPLPAAVLADIYAGRHDKVPSEVLREAVHFLKYSYAVYSLEPKIEAPASVLDLVCCCACARAPIDPQDTVFRGLSELEALDDDASIELLHLNCSNRVLAHLPYMICLDHGKKAVVLSIRGTISAADIVTDAVVYPEPLDAFLPPDIKQELSEPAFAHAGMVAAAKAIFQDMTERGILQQLVSDEEAGSYAAPEEQEARRGGGGGGGAQRQSQSNADSGRASPGAEIYRLSGSSRVGGRGAAGTGRPSSSSGSSSPTNLQSSQREGAAGRLWEGTSSGAAESKGKAPGASPKTQEQLAAPPSAGFHHHSLRQGPERGQADGPAVGADARCKLSPGRQVGEIMRWKIEEEGWQLIVSGHSLGAGAAALVSLKLREAFPGLKCIAYSCPGGLVSKNLSAAMARFTTTVVVGKDAVPRATVGNMGRLVDEMVTALARCKQPKLKVLFMPWWRRRKEQFRELFYSYDDIPAEPLRTLQRYYESRARLGQPLSMYPPGRVLFLRPIKTRAAKEWEGVWIRPKDIVAEGLLISPHMYRDHLCSMAYEALTAAADRASLLEGGAPPGTLAEADVRPSPRGPSGGSGGPSATTPHATLAATRLERQRREEEERRLQAAHQRRQEEERRRQRAARQRAAQRMAAQHSSSLQEVLIAAP